MNHQPIPIVTMSTIRYLFRNRRDRIYALHFTLERHGSFSSCDS